MAVAGPVVGQALCALMDERRIGHHFEQQVTLIDEATRTIRFEEEEASYDLLIGIPPHRAPSVLKRAGLVDVSGYVPVHPQTLELLSDLDTLEVHYPGVYAIGDVAAIRLLNSILLPKAGVFAEGEAQVVAAAIAADINGESRPGVYNGHGLRYIDVGSGVAAYGAGEGFAYPDPRVTLHWPAGEGRQAKFLQTGGPLGGVLPASQMDITLDFEAMARSGAILGSGGIIVADERAGAVDMTRVLVAF